MILTYFIIKLNSKYLNFLNLIFIFHFHRGLILRFKGTLKKKVCSFNFNYYYLFISNQLNFTNIIFF